jgi:hypothetical protein
VRLKNLLIRRSNSYNDLSVHRDMKDLNLSEYNKANNTC